MLTFENILKVFQAYLEDEMCIRDSFKHDPKGKVAEAYKILTKEVLNNAEKRRKHQLEGVR